MDYDNMHPVHGAPKCNKPVFIDRMIWIGVSRSKRIAKYCGSLGKRDPVLCQVGTVLYRVPLELHN